MANSGIYHIAGTVPVTKSNYESEAHHALAHGNSFPTSPSDYQLFFRDDEGCWYIYYDEGWHLLNYSAADGRPQHNTTKRLIIPGCVAYETNTMTLDAGGVFYLPIKVSTPITLDALVIEVTAAAAAGTKARLGIYNADINWQPTSLVGSTSELAIDAIAVVSGAFAHTLNAGRYLLAYHANGEPTVRFVSGPNEFSGLLSTLGASCIAKFFYVWKAYAAFSDPGTAWDNVDNLNAPGRYFVFCSVATP